MTHPIRQALEALELVRACIVSGADVGFDHKEGEWAERLYRSQWDTHNAVKALRSHLESEEAKDAELLDWLEKVGDIAITRFRNGVGGPLLYEVENGRANTEHTGATLREAIHAALSNTQVEGGCNG